MRLSDSLCLSCLFSRPQNCAIQWWIHDFPAFQIHHPIGINSTAPAPLLVVISSLYIFLPSHQKYSTSGRCLFFWATSYMSISDPWAHIRKKWDFMAIHLLSTWLPQHILFEMDIGPFYIRPAASSQWLCISTSFTGLALFAILKMTEESMMRSSTPLSEQCNNQLILLCLASLSFCAYQIFLFCMNQNQGPTNPCLSFTMEINKCICRCTFLICTSTEWVSKLRYPVKFIYSKASPEYLMFLGVLGFKHGFLYSIKLQQQKRQPQGCMFVSALASKSNNENVMARGFKSA